MAKYNKFADKLNQNTEEADDFFVSYSDLVTLLMTFFITMVAVSNVDVDKFVKIAFFGLNFFIIDSEVSKLKCEG